jgi:hypothetical protein
MNKKLVIVLLGILILGAIIFLGGPSLKAIVGLVFISHIALFWKFQEVEAEQANRQGQIRSLRRSIEESAQEIHKLKKLL